MTSTIAKTSLGNCLKHTVPLQGNVILHQREVNLTSGISRNYRGQGGKVTHQVSRSGLTIGLLQRGVSVFFALYSDF